MPAHSDGSATTTRFALRTLAGPTLTGPAGPITPSDPLALPLLCLVAVAGSEGVAEAEVQLCLTPDLTATQAGPRLERASAALERSTGDELVQRRADRWFAALHQVELDVTLDPASTLLTPGEQARFLEGMTVAGSPEFSEWVAKTRPNLRRAASLDIPSVHLAKRTIRMGASATIMVAGTLLLIAVYATRAKPPARFSPGDPVVLADLDNQTGDTLFDRSLTDAAAIGLEQSPQLRLVARSRIVGALRRMGIPDPDTARFQAALAREVAIRENVGYYITLTIARDGDGYRLVGAVNDASGARPPFTAEANAETRAGTIAALDRLLQDIRAHLGERRSERASRTVPLPEATTASLEALRSYASGGRAWSRGQFVLAKELWERALDLDTGFTMAMAALGSFHYYHHDRVRGEQYYREATKRINRVTEWERLRILDGYAGYRGDVDSAVALGRTMAERFPNVETWYNYGTGLMQAGRPTEAIVALTKALTFDTTAVNVYLNLATSSTGLGRLPDAIRYYRRAAQFDSLALERPPISSEYGDKLIRTGAFAEADRHFRGVLAKPDLYYRVLAHRGLGGLALWQGKIDEAVGHFRDATEAGLQDKSQLTIARNYLLEGMILQLAGDSAKARETIDRAVPLADSNRFEPQFLALLGHGFLRVGEVDRADLLLTKIVARGDTLAGRDRAAWQFLAGAINVAQGNHAAGLEQLRQSAKFPNENLRLAWQAEGLAGTGDLTGAATALDSIPDNATTIAENSFEWYRAFLTKGMLEERRGNPRAAIGAYRQLLNQWQTGDSAAALPRFLRARLAALGAR